MDTLRILRGALALPLLLAGCAIIDGNDGADTPGEPDVVVVQEGRRVALPAHDATLTFVEKTEDSRCPTNVVCVWIGRVVIRLAFARSGQAPASFEMVGFVGPDGHTGAGGPGVTHDAFGLRFTLESLDPYPVAGVEQPGPVTAKIRVEALR